MAINKPVAWMQVHHKDNKPTKFSLVQTWEDDIPLYTHPVKELTDEEIDDICDYEYMDYPCNDRIREVRRNCARAILRKAQEK